MNRIEISDSAKADIKDISSYTRKKYGRKQVKIYTDKLYGHIEFLLQTPFVGHMRSDIPNGYKAKNAEKHVIIYAIKSDILYIARILHNRMDFTQQDIH